jgi:hypothetical protein
MLDKKYINLEKITHYIQNPIMIKNKKIENDEKMVMPVYLTEKEKKKLSRSARL